MDDIQETVIDKVQPAAQTGKCFIKGNTFGPILVEFAIKDGKAIFEGDIVLGNAQPGEKADIIIGVEYRWPNEEIPYIIDPGLPEQERVTNAIAHWQRCSPIKFVLRTRQNQDQYPNYLNFYKSEDGCSSHVGMRGGRQDVAVGDECSKGNVIHEIGHAVGLWHEQSRKDRDEFVKIFWDNIKPGYKKEFDQHIIDGHDEGRYDYGSVMHYIKTAFSKDDKPTIEPSLPGAIIGQRYGLSRLDIAAVYSMYPFNRSTWH